MRMARASLAAASVAGAWEVAKIKLRALFFKYSIITLLLHAKPPSAPRDLLKVPMIISGAQVLP